jgi:hypothetical protein
MRGISLAGLLLLLLGAAEAVAQPTPVGGDVVYSKKDQIYKPREGEYGGVTPGVIYPYADEGYKHRRMWKAPAKMPKNTIFWVGFQPRDGGSSRVFLQTSQEMPYTQALRGATLVVNVAGARLANSNARRRIDSRFFESALAEVVAQRAKGGVEVRITFKKPADAREARAGFAKEADGYHYLYLDFGAATP